MKEVKNVEEISYESVHSDIGIEYLIYLFVDYSQGFWFLILSSFSTFLWN